MSFGLCDSSEIDTFADLAAVDGAGAVDSVANARGEGTKRNGFFGEGNVKR